MQLQDYFDLSESSDVATFRSRLVEMAAAMDFGIISCMLVVENSGGRGKHSFHTVGNIPISYENSSADLAKGASDPVLKRLKELSVPFAYSQDLYVSEGVGDLWEEQAQYGFKCGVAVALHLPNQQHFVLGVDREQSLPESDRGLTRIMADLQLLAVHAQAAASRLLSPFIEPPGIPKMSRRELEVLQWTKSGKTAWETGQILGISEQGVNYHFRSILQKLDVQSKHQAVLRSIALGIIGP